MLGSREAPQKAGSARTTAARLTAAFSIRSMSITALSLLAAVGLATAAAGGSYAYLNAAAPLSGGTVIAGTASLTIASPVQISTNKLYPGQSVYGSVTVTNTGNVALALDAKVTGSTPLSQELTIALRVVSSASDCAATPVTPAWSVGTIPAPGLPAMGTLPAGSSAFLCVSAALPLVTNAGQGQTTSFNVQLDGTQV
ncbi:TasA family protein [Leifsonia sp. YAF41]|uniref:TasA family protein n=1 Tax=Leifsonia sp. YAF41 TaxID=3233086 RepID=UPI003F9B1994